MKRNVLIAVMVLLAGVCFGQEKKDAVCEVQKLQGEIWAGWTTPLGGYHDGIPKSNAAIGLALRYHLDDSPFNVGVFLSLYTADRDFLHIPGSTAFQTNRTLGYGVTFEYKYNRCGNYVPFAGIGIGAGYHDIVDTVTYYSHPGTTAIFVPKFGVELWHWVRLNAYFQISRKGYNNFGLSLGLCIGGRQRR